MPVDHAQDSSGFDQFIKILQVEIKKLFQTPTHIQRKAFDVILKGSNVLVIAPTGTGKTDNR